MNTIVVNGRKVYEGTINSLNKNQIFVFGSNTQGKHGLGAAYSALMFFGAKYGQASGLMGQSYGIVTKDLTKTKHPSIPPTKIITQIDTLYEYAVAHLDNEFLVAYLATGRPLNGYTPKEIAAFFYRKNIPQNIIFNILFQDLVIKNDN